MEERQAIVKSLQQILFLKGPIPYQLWSGLKPTPAKKRTMEDQTKKGKSKKLYSNPLG